jgi:hypothetical protein
MLEGPFPNQVSEALERCRLLAEAEYQAKNYNAARWRWVVLRDYWQYLHELKPHHQGGHQMALHGTELWETLRMTLPIHAEGSMGLIKVDLR